MIVQIGVPVNVKERITEDNNQKNNLYRLDGDNECSMPRCAFAPSSLS